jgi:hypothetical protein
MSRFLDLVGGKPEVSPAPAPTPAPVVKKVEPKTEVVVEKPKKVAIPPINYTKNEEE